jgi:adenosylhomocysteine nucleosidase
MRLAAVTGLAAEARILTRLGIPALATAGDPARIEAACRQLIRDGADALVSFGIAGALAPSLAPGTLLLPRVVRDETAAAFPVDAAWRDGVALRLGVTPEAGDMLGRAAIAGTAAEKSALHQRMGVVAIDLESHVVAEAARRAGLRFLVLRAVADPASFTLPPAAAVGLDADGRAALGPVLASLLRAPSQLPSLVALAAHTRRALRALRRAAVAFSSSREG